MQARNRNDPYIHMYAAVCNMEFIDVVSALILSIVFYDLGSLGNGAVI